jgi:hypothetical protein
MSGPARTAGIEQQVFEGVAVRGFTVSAKTIADCFKFRNKVGLEAETRVLHHRVYQIIELHNYGFARNEEDYYYGRLCCHDSTFD